MRGKQMGIERLTTAARAAGYAMATSDELLVSGTAQKPNNPWRVASAKPLKETRKDAGHALGYSARIRELLGSLTSRVTA